jgi:hypothetical protein
MGPWKAGSLAPPGTVAPIRISGTPSITSSRARMVGWGRPEAHRIGDAPAVAGALQVLGGDDRHLLRAVQSRAAPAPPAGNLGGREDHELLLLPRREPHLPSPLRSLSAGQRFSLSAFPRIAALQPLPCAARTGTPGNGTPGNHVGGRRAADFDPQPGMPPYQTSGALSSPLWALGFSFLLGADGARGLCRELKARGHDRPCKGRTENSEQATGYRATTFTERAGLPRLAVPFWDPTTVLADASNLKPIQATCSRP